MEPRHLCRGNLTKAAGENAWKVVLQWSRGISAAETTSTGWWRASAAALQWSRGISAAETPPSSRTRRRYPRCFNGAAASLPRKLRRARPDGRGGHARFNGAAASLPRKPSATGTDRSFSAGFNGAAASLPRKRSARTRSRSSTSCFNGAAASLPRKRDSHARGAPSYTRFNGAAASLPRKLQLPGTEDLVACVLQWSRGISAAETASCSASRPSRSAASMEPRHLCRGNDQT